MKRVIGRCALAIVALGLGLAAPASASAPTSTLCIPISTLDPAWGSGDICS